MTPHHEERAIWRGDGGKPSAIAVWFAWGALPWLWLYAIAVAVWGW